MARSAVDMPDPLENASGNALGGGGTDDLLAQLAGDEVDRLLSEGDATPPDPRFADRSTDGAPPGGPRPAEADLLGPPGDAEAELAGAPDGVSDEAELDQLFEGLSGLAGATGKADAVLAEPIDGRPAGASGGAGAAAPGEFPDAVTQNAQVEPIDARSAEQIIEARADELVARARREAEEAKVTASAVAGAVPPASAADALAAEMEADDAAHAAALRRMKAMQADDADANANAPATQATFHAPVDAAGLALEHDAATADASAPSESGAATASTDAAQANPTTVDESAVNEAIAEDEMIVGRTPMLVRVLEWFNAPLDGLSTSVREALGKVAIVTSMNAIAVFAYVLFFRKH